MTENDKNNILLAEFAGYKVFTGTTKDKDFDQKILKSDLCFYEDGEIKFTKGNMAGNKWNPFFKGHQAENIVEKILMQNRNSVLLITPPIGKKGNWVFGLGTEVDRKDNQHFINMELFGAGNRFNKARYEFMLRYVKKTKDGVK